MFVPRVIIARVAAFSARRMRVLVAAIVALSGVSTCFPATIVLAAQTTGSLTGTVLDAKNVPIAGAAISAVSPSANATATSDARGQFRFLSLAPDAYTVSMQKQGFEPIFLTGVNVFAEQEATVTLRSQPRLRTIGTVTARAASDLVNSGATTNVYTVTPATSAAASTLGGGGSLNQAYSGLASVPGVYIPQGQSGIYQTVFIRGGDYTQLGYQFDGVPIQRAFDQYPSTALSSLGQQNLQVYAGSAPLDQQSTGLAGSINQVIKTGTYPGFILADLGLGSPTFYHHASIEVGGAAKNRNFSYYLATAGYNQEFRYFSQQNGAQLDHYAGTPYNLVRSGCAGIDATVGCYTNSLGVFGSNPTSPSGYALGPFSYGLQNQIADRESIVNLHFGLPHKDGSRDDVQLLFNNSLLHTDFQTSQNDWTYAAANVISGTSAYNGARYPSCTTLADPTTAGLSNPCGVYGPSRQAYLDHSIYTGPVGVPLTANLAGNVRQYYFPNSPLARTVGAPIGFDIRDSYDNRASIEKLQFTKTLGSNAFARVYGYEFYSDWLQNGPNSTVDNLAGNVVGDYEIATHTRGLALSVSDQVNRQNLLNFGAGYTYAGTVRWNNGTPSSSANVAYAVSSANPMSGACYGAAGAVKCGADAWRYELPPVDSIAAPLAPSDGAPSLSAIGAQRCGGAPCEYFVVDNGLSGSYSTVAPRFSNLSFEDRFKPTDRLLLSLGIHYDDFRYDLADTTVPGGPQPNSATTLQRAFWVNSFIASNCQNVQTLVLVPRKSINGPCPTNAVPVAFTDQSSSVSDHHAFEPRFAATYTVDPLSVIRAAYSKVEQPASSSFQQYNGAQGSLPDQAQFYPVGFRSPAHTIYPEESYNTDFSFEHRFKGSDASFSLSPFYRTTNRQIFSVLLDPKTNFSSGVNVGKSYIEGAELELRKGDFARNGLAAQLSYTYTYGRVHYDTLPNGHTVIEPINAGIRQYNSYTSYCATHARDLRCAGGTPGGVPAAPCYTPVTASGGGTAESTCVPGDVANPIGMHPCRVFSIRMLFTRRSTKAWAQPRVTQGRRS